MGMTTNFDRVRYTFAARRRSEIDPESGRGRVQARVVVEPRVLRAQGPVRWGRRSSPFGGTRKCKDGSCVRSGSGSSSGTGSEESGVALGRMCDDCAKEKDLDVKTENGRESEESLTSVGGGDGVNEKGGLGTKASHNRWKGWGRRRSIVRGQKITEQSTVGRDESASESTKTEEAPITPPFNPSQIPLQFGSSPTPSQAAPTQDKPSTQPKEKSTSDLKFNDENRPATATTQSSTHSTQDSLHETFVANLLTSAPGEETQTRRGFNAWLRQVHPSGIADDSRMFHSSRVVVVGYGQQQHRPPVRRRNTLCLNPVRGIGENLDGSEDEEGSGLGVKVPVIRIMPPSPLGSEEGELRVLGRRVRRCVISESAGDEVVVTTKSISTTITEVHLPIPILEAVIAPIEPVKPPLEPVEIQVNPLTHPIDPKPTPAPTSSDPRTGTTTVRKILRKLSLKSLSDAFTSPHTSPTTNSDTVDPISTPIARKPKRMKKTESNIQRSTISEDPLNTAPIVVERGSEAGPIIRLSKVESRRDIRGLSDSWDVASGDGLVERVRGKGEASVGGSGEVGGEARLGDSGLPTCEEEVMVKESESRGAVKEMESDVTVERTEVVADINTDKEMMDVGAQKSIVVETAPAASKQMGEGKSALVGGSVREKKNAARVRVGGIKGLKGSLSMVSLRRRAESDVVSEVKGKFFKGMGSGSLRAKSFVA